MGNQEPLDIHSKIKELEDQLDYVKRALVHVYDVALKEQIPKPFIVQIKYLDNYDKSWGEMGVAKEGDACFDIRAAISEPIKLFPGKSVLVPNGFSVDVGEEKEMQIRSRSGLAAKKQVFVTNAPGTVDSCYRGEVKTPLINLGTKVLEIMPGDRIAQAVVKEARTMCLEEVMELDDSERGDGGFGHTGQ